MRDTSINVARLRNGASRMTHLRMRGSWKPRLHATFEWLSLAAVCVCVCGAVLLRMSVLLALLRCIYHAINCI